MGRDTPRHFVERNGACYWQPSTKLRALGWEARALGRDRAAAVGRAIALNGEVDAWRTAGRQARVGVASPTLTRAFRPGTVDALIALYQGSDDYPTNANTKRSYDYALRHVAKWIGPLPARAVSPRIARAHYKALAATAPAMAATVMRVARAMFGAARTLAERNDPLHVVDNPFRELRLAGSDPSGIRWSAAERDAMGAAATALGFESIALAIRLNWWLGQREADILALPAGALDGETLPIRQGKTAQRVYLPVSILPAIAATREAWFAYRRAGRLESLTHLLLSEATGRPWDEHLFRKKFRAVRSHAAATLRAAGQAAPAERLETLTYMHLRHTAVCEMYEAGCTIPEIAAVSGHTLASVTRILERYGLRTRQLAENAIRRRLIKEQGSAKEHGDAGNS